MRVSPAACSRRKSLHQNQPPNCAGSAPTKQLRLVETISLGEKRFAAILYADGRRFLVGGGTAGVSLLAPLDETPESLEDIESLQELSELSE